MGLGIIKEKQTAKMTLFVVQILTLLLAELSPICATNQVNATLYSQDGRTVTFSGLNSPDLRVHNFDNIAVSAQMQGLWIVYEHYNYYGAFQFITNTYEDLHYNLKGKVSSIRLVGSSDNYKESTLTLYHGINLQGEEEYIAADRSNLGGSAASLIITGTEPWTLYANPKFEGNSVCVYPPEPVYDTKVFGALNKGIGSGRRGCFE